MNIDLKHDFLKSSLGNLHLGQKNIQTTIEKSMIASPGQKSLSMDMQNESSENMKSNKEMANKEMVHNKLNSEKSKNQKSSNETTPIIERNPLMLLKFF